LVEKPADSRDTKDQWILKQRAKAKQVKWCTQALMSARFTRVATVMKKWVVEHYSDLNDQHVEAINNFMRKFLKYESESLAAQLEGALRKVPLILRG